MDHLPTPLASGTVLDGRLRILGDLDSQPPFRIHRAADTDTGEPCIVRRFLLPDKGRFSEVCKRRKKVGFTSIVKLNHYFTDPGDPDVGCLEEEDIGSFSAVSSDSSKAEDLLQELLAIVKELSQTGMFHGAICVESLRRRATGQLLVLGDRWVYDELLNKGVRDELHDVKTTIGICESVAAETNGRGAVSDLTWLKRAIIAAESTDELTADSVLLLRYNGINGNTKDETDGACKPAGTNDDGDCENVTLQAPEEISVIETPSPPKPPTIVLFEVEPNPVTEGSEFHLRWNVKEADAIEIQPEFEGAKLDVAGDILLIASATKTYSLVATTATGLSTRSEAEIKVVLQPRILEFTASKDRVRPGEAITLSWTVENAPLVTLVGIGDYEASATAVVIPATTTTYQLVANWQGDTVSRSLEVIAAPIEPDPPQPHPSRHAEETAKVDVADDRVPDGDGIPTTNRQPSIRVVKWLIAILTGVSGGYVIVQLREPPQPMVEAFDPKASCLAEGDYPQFKWELRGTTKAKLTVQKNDASNDEPILVAQSNSLYQYPRLLTRGTYVFSLHAEGSPESASVRRTVKVVSQGEYNSACTAQ